MSDIEVSKCDIKGAFSAPVADREYDYLFSGLFLARAVIDSSVICDNIGNDGAVLDMIKAFGAKIACAHQSVNVRAGKLCGITVDISQCPHLAPLAVMLALFSHGKTRICGFSNAQDIQTLMLVNMRILGVRCEYNSDDLWIWPQKSLGRGVLDAKGDSFAALAFILISTCTNEKTVVRNVDGLIEIYPEFEEIFTGLGGKYKISNRCVL